MLKTLCLFSAVASFNCLADCQKVYTIGYYDDGLIAKGEVIKLGPIPADETDGFPKTFLEKNGSYAGGEAFCTPEDAYYAIKTQVANGILRRDVDWKVYELNATWDEDVYELKPNDFRIRSTVSVKGLIAVG